MTEEIRLLKASLGGDTTAFEKIVYKYQSLVCAITFCGTGRLDISEDLAQETFLRAWRELFQLKELEKFRPWLCSIARNLLRNHYRTTAVDRTSHCDTDTMAQMVSTKSPNPSEQLISREEEMILSQALMQIPEEYREPLVLYYRQQQSTKEVAENLDLNEATVRTRLSRGRQMLKDQVAVMVERTLEKTGPSKKFTKAVMVAIGGGLAAGTAATATAASVNSGNVSSTAAGGASAILTGVGIKVAAIAATILIIITGIMIYHYWNPSSQPENTAQVTVQPDLTEVKQKVVNPKESVITAKKNGDAQQIEPQSNPVQVQPQLEKPTVGHPDWPKTNEPISNIYKKEILYERDGSTREYKTWNRLPDHNRHEERTYVFIDNGRERIEIQTEQKKVIKIKLLNRKPSPFYTDSSKEELHEIYQLFRDDRNNNLKSSPDNPYRLNQIGQDENGSVIIYEILIKASQNKYKAFVDAKTLLPEKIIFESFYRDSNFIKMETTYDFSPIPDAIFIYQEEKFFPEKQREKTIHFNGIVCDINGNPVQKATVFALNRDLCAQYGYLDTITNETGKFTIDYCTNQTAMRLPILFFAIPTGQANEIAWTILSDPDEAVIGNIKRYIPGFGGTARFNPERRSDRLLIEDVNDISLVLEPAGKIKGIISDVNGNPVPNAIITASFILCDDKGLQYSSLNTNNLWRVTSSQQGYYEIQPLPQLWKNCEYRLNISPRNHISTSQVIKLAGPLGEHEANFRLYPSAITVRGILKDNYGAVLSERYIWVKAEGETVNCWAKTDPNGFFEIRNGPDTTDLQVYANLSHNTVNSSDSEKYNAFVYYPDVSIDVPYQSGQTEYYVEMTAILPENEIEVYAVNTDGSPISEMCLQLRDDEGKISSDWKSRNFTLRTDENGWAKFTRIPDIEKMQIIFPPNNATNYSQEISSMNNESWKTVDRSYIEKYRPTNIPVIFVPGQNKYQMTVTIPTQEEYKQQRELLK